MYSGSCHCGRIAFEVEGEFADVKECNCSHCSRKGYLLWFVPRAISPAVGPRVNRHIPLQQERD